MVRELRRRALAGAAALGLACAPAPPPDVLLVVIDTLRADRLGVYGSRRGLTPFLDSLAERSTVFHAAYAASSWTSPSVASLLTSRYPSQHGTVRFSSVLAQAELTLPELLRERGYATAGFSANWLLRGERGFAQGYDLYRVAPAPKPLPARAGQVNQRALAWLDARLREPRRPLFLYLHYMEPHTPYAPEEAALARVLGDRPRPDTAAVNQTLFFADRIRPKPAQLAAIEALYDVQVASVDAGLEALFAELEERGLLEGLLVVVTADHGEEFQDHGFVGHAHSLHDELIRVPLLVRVPGQSARIDATGVVSLLDLAPTVLEWAGGAAPETFEGRSLAPWLRNEAGWLRVDGRAERSVFSELLERIGPPRTTHRRAVVMGFGKLIDAEGSGREFHAGAPGSSEGDALTPEQRHTLESALGSFEERMQRAAGPHLTRPLDAAAREHLRALGYAEE